MACKKGTLAKPYEPTEEQKHQALEHIAYEIIMFLRAYRSGVNRDSPTATYFLSRARRLGPQNRQSLGRVGARFSAGKVFLSPNSHADQR